MIRIFLLTTLFLILAPPVEAARFSGEYLLKVCAVDRDGNEKIAGGKIACQSYISGVIDYHNFLRSLNLTGEYNFCVPADVALNKLQLQILLYIKKRETLYRKFVAAPAVAQALFHLYPCPGARKNLSAPADSGEVHDPADQQDLGNGDKRDGEGQDP
ncbi:MAG: hypothetical protein GC137_03760 [Alphaproteobacteria bacterium]|nr:hypothetical protein [Alphaproteobacteria bacterium]